MLTKDKKFYRSFFHIMSVMVLQNIVVLSVNLVDNIMIGAYSEVSLSGVAAVNQLQFLFQQLAMGVAEAVVVLGSQYFGQRRLSPIRSVTAGAMMLGGTIAVVFFLGTTFFPQGILHLFTDTAEITEEGVRYLALIRFTYLPFMLSTVLLAHLRSMERVKISFFTSVLALIVNCSLNYIYIGGHFGAPALGVKGAAIGTVAARVLEFAVILLYTIRTEKKLNGTRLSFDKAVIRDYFKQCPSFVIVAGMFGVSTGLQTVILGHMTDSAIAANSVATTLFQMLKVASIGAASATAVIIGKTVGTGDRKKLKEYVRTLQVIFLIIGTVTSVALFFLRYPILSLYDLSEETARLSEQFILVLCVTGFGTAYEMPVITGIIRGGGDAKFVLINDLISIWGIVLPLSFLGAFLWHFPPVWVVFCLNADQLFKCGAAAIKANRYRWIKKLTRDDTP